jgi:hypothetical protein
MGKNLVYAGKHAPPLDPGGNGAFQLNIIISKNRKG